MKEVNEAVWDPHSKKLLIVADSSSFIVDIDGTGRSELSGDEANRLKSQWSPEEKVLLEWRNRYIYWINPDGTKTGLVEAEQRYALSPDGRMIAYVYLDQFGGYRLFRDKHRWDYYNPHRRSLASLGDQNEEISEIEGVLGVLRRVANNCIKRIQKLCCLRIGGAA